MNLLSDIITYVRRIIKSPSNAVITDNLIIDYINRFWIMDVDARIQLFDLKTKYQFQTSPAVDQYNMPLYNVQTEPGGQTIGNFPIYQGFVSPAYINGVQVPLQTQKNGFYNIWPNVVQDLNGVAIGNGGNTYQFQLPILSNPLTPLNPPVNGILRGHIDITGIISTGTNQDPPIVSTLNLSVPAVNTFPSFYITSTDSTGANVVVSDSGQFFVGNVNSGLLMVPGNSTTLGNTALPGGYITSFAITAATQANPCVLSIANSSFQVGQFITISGVNGMIQLNGNTYQVTGVTATTVTINVNSTGFTAYTSGGTASSINNYVNYLTGAVSVSFPIAIPPGVSINAQCFYFETGLPRGILYYNNTLTLRSPPDQAYLVELDAYLSPAAFLNTGSAIPFGYMAEYIARGAARKILSDTGDVEQFQFYEPLFREQEQLVWKRSQRQWTNDRTQTIYSQGVNQGQSGYNNLGGSTL